MKRPERAYFDVGNSRYLLLRIATDEMDVILKDPRLKNVIGHPNYFDEFTRLWPKPAEGIEVVFQ